MSATLDRKRPFGEVWGVGESHRYEQDGKCFDQAGEEVVVGKAETKPAATGGAPTQTVVTVDGQPVVLESLDLPALHALATKLGLTLNARTGEVKVRAAIVEATKPAATGGGQLDAQLNA